MPLSMSNLLGAGRNDFGSFYVADGDLNVNGVVGKGQKQIEELYNRAASTMSS